MRWTWIVIGGALSACGGPLITPVAQGARVTVEEGGVRCTPRVAEATGTVGDRLVGEWEGVAGDEHFVLEFFADRRLRHVDLVRSKEYAGLWTIDADGLLVLQFGDPDSAPHTGYWFESGALRLEYYPDPLQPVTCVP